MDNYRVILAVVLSTLVIFVFHFIMSSQQKKLATNQPQIVSKNGSQTTKPKEVKPLSPEEGSERSTFPPPKKTYSYQVKDVNIDTSLYHAVLTEAGGRFKSFTLKKYRVSVDPNSPLVQLISAPKLGLPVEIYPVKDPSLAVAPYKASLESLRLTNGAKGSILFEPIFQKPLLLEKEFSFQDRSYLFDLKVKVKNPSEESQTERLLFRLVASPVSKTYRYVFHGPAYSHEGILEEVKLKKTGSFSEYAGELDWTGFDDPYFLLAMVPPPGENWRATFRRLDEKTHEIILWSPEFTLPPKGTKELDLKLYFGPKSLSILKRAGYNLKSAVHFGFFDPLAKPLLHLMQFFYRYTHNYGIAIIILTFIIRILFWPLNHLSYKSMKKMQEIQPLIQKLREKYKDDKERLNKELMQLYRTYKVNPFMGCLPMAIQIPVFFALYKVLLVAIELRHAPFWGWINDLSAPDRLYVGFHIPYLGGLPVLTILMGISMYVQQKLSPTSLDPTQARMMLLMPIIFTILFINFPSGLVLYWLTNNILSIIQQCMTSKMVTRSRR